MKTQLNTTQSLNVMLLFCKNWPFAAAWQFSLLHFSITNFTFMYPSRRQADVLLALAKFLMPEQWKPSVTASLGVWVFFDVLYYLSVLL